MHRYRWKLQIICFIQSQLMILPLKATESKHGQFWYSIRLFLIRWANLGILIKIRSCFLYFFQRSWVWIWRFSLFTTTWFRDPEFSIEIFFLYNQTGPQFSTWCVKFYGRPHFSWVFMECLAISLYHLSCKTANVLHNNHFTREWVSNYIHGFRWDNYYSPCPNFNGSWA